MQKRQRQGEPRGVRLRVLMDEDGEPHAAPGFVTRGGHDDWPRFVGSPPNRRLHLFLSLCFHVDCF